MRASRNEETGERGNEGTGERGTVLAFARSIVPAFSSFLRRLAGMPDYPAYLEHLRRCHPNRPVPSERQFYDDFVNARYEDGPTRCC